MRLDLAEMRRRGTAREENYENVYEALVESRSFEQARALTKTHAFAPAQAVPDVADDVVGDGPTTLLVKDHGEKLERKPVGLRKGRLIVVVASPLCHFCQRAIRSIERDAVLRPLFRDHAVWMVPPR